MSHLLFFRTGCCTYIVNVGYDFVFRLRGKFCEAFFFPRFFEKRGISFSNKTGLKIRIRIDF